MLSSRRLRLFTAGVYENGFAKWLLTGQGDTSEKQALRKQKPLPWGNRSTRTNTIPDSWKETAIYNSCIITCAQGEQTETE
ncbi:hypothetical protein JZ751_012078, partial [Albula glossodonta]